MKQNKLGYAHGKIVTLYIVYELKNRRIDSPDFTVQNGFFGAVKITKNVNTSHYKYEGYGICFDGESSFIFGNRIDAKNVIIFVLTLVVVVVIQQIKLKIFMFSEKILFKE